MPDDQQAIIAMLDALPVAELAEISKQFTPDEDAKRVPQFDSRFKIAKVKNDSQAFEMDDELIKVVRGVIIDFHLTKTWYERSYDESGGGNRPDCYSKDSVYPLADSGKKQAEKCSICPRNQFHPDPDPKRAGKKKKDCRDTITLYIWNPRVDRPILLRVSTMNRKRVSDFIKLLADKGIAKELVTCEFTLFKDNETADVEFSGLAIKPAGTVLQMVPFFQKPENRESAIQWFTEKQLETLTPKMVVECIARFKSDNKELLETEGAAASAMADNEKPAAEEKKPAVNQPTQKPKSQVQQEQQKPVEQKKPPVQDVAIDYDEVGDEPPF